MLTPNGLDALLQKLMHDVEDIGNSQGSFVKLLKAELDFLRDLEISRDFMMEVLQNQSDRSLLLEVFGGRITRIARIRVVCESVCFSTMNAGDQRLRTSLSACESVEKVFFDLGLKDELQIAREHERELLEGEDDDTADVYVEDLAHASAAEAKAVDLDREVKYRDALTRYADCQREYERELLEGDDDDTPDVCLEHLARASAAEGEAVDFDREGKYPQALAKYTDCQRELALAVASLAEGSKYRSKLQALTGYADCQRELAQAVASLAEGSEDKSKLPRMICQLLENQRQIADRVQYLEADKDDEPLHQVGGHIKQAEMSFNGKRRKKESYIAACTSILKHAANTVASQRQQAYSSAHRMRNHWQPQRAAQVWRRATRMLTW